MWRRLLIIIVVGAALLLLAERFGPGGVQRRGMKAAESFRQTIAPAIAADPRFAAVEMTVMTHPSLRVYGEVPDEKALRDLNLIARAPPGAPFRVLMHTNVKEQTATQPPN